MAMYYGDENGKAQEVVVVGMQGPAGPQGPQGPQGEGVPTGGTAGQVLMQSNDGPVWANLPNGWNIVDSYVDSHYKLYSNGNMRALIPIGVPSFTSTAQPTTISGLYTFYYSEQYTQLPSEHCPSYNIRTGYGRPFETGSDFINLAGMNVEVNAAGNITVYYGGFSLSESGTSGTIGLPSIFYMTNDANL